MDMNVSAGCFGLRRRVRNGHDRTSRRKAMALIFCARFLLSNQRPCRWLVAGKDGEQRGAWVRLVPTASEFRQQINQKDIISHQLTLPHLTTRRPSYRNQIWQPLQFNRCKKSVLRIKSVTQYGFALDFRLARERSKKTEAATKLQTSEAFTVLKGRSGYRGEKEINGSFSPSGATAGRAPHKASHPSWQSGRGRYD